MMKSAPASATSTMHNLSAGVVALHGDQKVLSNPLLALLRVARRPPWWRRSLSVRRAAVAKGDRLRGMPLALARWTRRAAPRGPAGARRLGYAERCCCAARRQFHCRPGMRPDALRRLTTEDMFGAHDRAAGAPTTPDRTTPVLALEAHLIAFETVGPRSAGEHQVPAWCANRRAMTSAPFREVWMLARRTRGLALARQQALM